MVAAGQGYERGAEKRVLVEYWGRFSGEEGVVGSGAVLLTSQKTWTTEMKHHRRVSYVFNCCEIMNKLRLYAEQYLSGALCWLHADLQW